MISWSHNSFEEAEEVGRFLNPADSGGLQLAWVNRQGLALISKDQIWDPDSRTWPYGLNAPQRQSTESNILARGKECKQRLPKGTYSQANAGEDRWFKRRNGIIASEIAFSRKKKIKYWSSRCGLLSLLVVVSLQSSFEQLVLNGCSWVSRIRFPAFYGHTALLSTHQLQSLPASI